MTDNDAVAEAIAGHRAQMGLLFHGRLLCTCNGQFDDTEDWAVHVAQAAMDALGLAQEWAAAYAHDDLVIGDEDFVRGEIDNFGGSLVSRLVSPWMQDHA